MSAVRSIVAQMGYTAFLAQMASHVQGGCLGSFCEDSEDKALTAAGFKALGTCEQLLGSASDADIPSNKIYVKTKIPGLPGKVPGNLEEIKANKAQQEWFKERACVYHSTEVTRIGHIFPGTVRGGHEDAFLNEVVKEKVSTYATEKVVGEGDNKSNVGTLFLEFAWQIAPDGTRIQAQATPDKGSANGAKAFTGSTYTWVQVHHDKYAFEYHGMTPATARFGYWKFNTGDIAQDNIEHRDMTLVTNTFPDDIKHQYRTLSCGPDPQQLDNAAITFTKGEETCVYGAHASIQDAQKVKGATLYKVPAVTSSFLEINGAVAEPRRDLQDIFKNRM